MVFSSRIKNDSISFLLDREMWRMQIVLDIIRLAVIKCRRRNFQRSAPVYFFTLSHALTEVRVQKSDAEKIEKYKTRKSGRIAL